MLKPAITIEPAFKELCPPLNPEERQMLEQNLVSEGCRDPLVIWRGVLLDGHNRMDICERHAIAFDVVEVPAVETQEQARNWIINNQLGRRNITAEQASYLRGKRYNAEKAGHGGEREASPQNGDLKTSDRLAAEYKVSKNTIQRDGAFAEAVDKIADNAGPAARDAILSRDAKISKAEVSVLAEADDPELQSDFVTMAASTDKTERAEAKQRLNARIERDPQKPKQSFTREEQQKQDAFMLDAAVNGRLSDFDQILTSSANDAAAAVEQVSIPRRLNEARRVMSWLQQFLTALEERHAS